MNIESLIADRFNVYHSINLRIHFASNYNHLVVTAVHTITYDYDDIII